MSNGNEFVFPTTGAIVKNKARLLAIDDASLPLRKNVCLHLSKPTVRKEPVLGPSPLDSNAPDNLATHFYGTVLHDAGKFRMWYYACHRGMNPDWQGCKKQQVAKTPSWLIGVKEDHSIVQGPLCYAESADGITWTKPALGQVLFKGSRENNALDLPHTVVGGTAVIRDDEDLDPRRRYKMVYQYFPDQTDPVIPEYGTWPSIACAVSPDGITWTLAGMPFVNQFVEPCSFIRYQDRYIVHSQVFPSWNSNNTEGGSGGGRTGIAHWTHNFDQWPDLWEWSFALPEPADPAQRGDQNPYDQVHLGVGAAAFGNVCVGVYGIWHNAPFGVDFEKTSCDLGLVVSNDGVRFREPAATPGQVFISRKESAATPVPGRDFSTILCQGNGILNVGDETRIYHDRWRNCGQKAEEIAVHYRGEVALATLPRDRWGSIRLNPGADEGVICSAPVMLPSGGWNLTLNADGVAGLSVEVADEHFNLMPEFSGDNSARTVFHQQVGNGRSGEKVARAVRRAGSGRESPDEGPSGPPQDGVSGGLDVPVEWAKGTAAALNGKTVRFRIRFKRIGDVKPMLYAVNLATK